MSDSSAAFEQGLDTDGEDPFGEDGGLSEFDASQGQPAGTQADQPVATEEPVEGIPVVSLSEDSPAAAAEPEVARETPEQAQEREAVEAGEREAARRAEIEELSNRDLIALIDSSPERSMDLRLAADERTRRVEKQREEQAKAEAEERAEATTVAPEGEPAGDEGAERPTPAAAATSPSANSGTTGAGEDVEPPEPPAAEPPAEVSNESGTVTHRRYVLLTPSGNGAFKEVHWYEDDKGKMVSKGTPGAKKQTIALARGQEDALDIGFRAMGSPEDGCKVVAVAETYFQVRHVQPDPDPPVRRKLVIR